MKLSELYSKTNKTLLSFELLPPLKGEHFDQVANNLEPLLEFNPACINITHHQQEVEYQELLDGSIIKRIIRKRPGTVGIAAAIQHKTEVQAVPHIICGGSSREEIENALIDLHFLGIHNLLILRGDPPVGHKYFRPEKDGHKHAVDLVKQVVNLNQGIYLDDELINTHPTDFCIGVAGYPEKHNEAPNMQRDIEFLKQKVDAGAGYIVTQMFFDNQKYFDFVKHCRDAGIEVPIIPGLKPISSKKQLTILPQTFHIDLPEDLVIEIQKQDSAEKVREAGIAWAIAQSKELIAASAPALHYYTMGKTTNVQKIVRAVF